MTQCAANLAGYLVQDLSSPLGAELDGQRESDAAEDHSPFRGFGTAGIWFPKGLMLRSAARLMCERLLLDWQDPNSMISSKPIEELYEKVRQVPSLKPEAIAERIEQSARIGHQMAAEALETLLSELESSIPAGVNEPGEWATKSVEKIVSFVGTQQSTDSTASYLQSRLSRTLSPIVAEHAAEWTNKLASVATRLMELPGRRIAAAEEGIKRLERHCNESAAYVQHRLTTLVSRSMQAGPMFVVLRKSVYRGAVFASLAADRCEISRLSAPNRARLRWPVSTNCWWMPRFAVFRGWQRGW